MSAPATYTETALASYMANALGEVGATLGWTAGNGKLDEAVNDALLSYGVDDIADATDTKKLRALARLYAWRAAVASLPAFYDFSSDEESFDRSQMLTGAKLSLSIAEGDCAEFGVGPMVAYIDAVDRTEDPYEFVPLTESVA